MTFPTILLLAVALAMDAFAVSISSGIQLRSVSIAQTLRIGCTFGAFQFAMPVFGWLAGVKAQSLIEDYDHWVAFALLAFVGGKMLKEAWESRGNAECACTAQDPTQGSSLLLLGIATSLDALAVGLSFAILQQSVWFPATVIGIVCFIISVIGIQLGRIICALPFLRNIGSTANALGGLVLLAIGFNILWQHGVFA